MLLNGGAKNRLYSSVLYILAVILSIIVVAGCSFNVKLVGPYDELVDKSVAQIQSKTTSHITKILANKGERAGSYDSLKEFYPNIKGDIDTLIVRSEVLEKGLKKTPLTDNFKSLKLQYDDLEILHQTPFNQKAISSAREAMNQSYRAIVKHLVYLKWNQKQPE
jgi:hypothetical protein